MADLASPLFAAHDTDGVLEELRELDGELLDDLGVQLELALRGDVDAVRRYVSGYRRLSTHVVREASESDIPPRVLVDVLANGAPDVPFLPWADRFAAGDAVGLELTNRARELLGSERLELAQASRRNGTVVDESAAQRFISRVRHHLSHPDDQSPLERLADAFGLSKTELASLFGVSRQAVDKWIRHGVPADRQDKLGTLLALVDLLERKLKHGRLPGVARRPADAYDGETMLDLIREDRHRELLESVRASFDWHIHA